VRQDLFPHAFGELARVHVGNARLGRDRKSGRDWQPNAGHLSQVAAFAAQEVTHCRVTLFERIYPLLCHSSLS